MNEVTTAFSPKSLQEAMEFAELISKSSMIPKDYVNNPGNILVAMQWGMEIGLHPLQGLQSIAVINGRPSLWGDAALALVLASPVCEYVDESASDATHGVCEVKRKGDAPHVQVFTIDDAKKAGLWGKAGPWTTYPSRMLIMRARSWALRDKFTDVLRGLALAEEIRDIEPVDVMPKPMRDNPIAIAQAAISVEDEEERQRLIADIDAVADMGTDSLKAAWEALTPELRKMHGGLSAATKERAKQADAFQNEEG